MTRETKQYWIEKISAYADAYLKDGDYDTTFHNHYIDAERDSLSWEDQDYVDRRLYDDILRKSFNQRLVDKCSYQGVDASSLIIEMLQTRTQRVILEQLDQ